jgi:hypothetical protein
LRIALADGGEEALTFDALADDSARFAHWLGARGIARGDCVAIVLEPSRAFYVAVFGAMKRGAIAVALFTLFGPDGLRLRVDDCKPRLLVTNGTKADMARAVQGPDVVVAADENTKLEQERVFDPLVSPDSKAAHEAMQAAEFMQTWLHSALLRLQRRLREAQEREHRAKWYADYEALKSKRDALAAEFRGVYTEFESEGRGSARPHGGQQRGDFQPARCALVWCEAASHRGRTGGAALSVSRETCRRHKGIKVARIRAESAASLAAWAAIARDLGRADAHDPLFSSSWWEAGERQRREQEANQRR